MLGTIKTKLEKGFGFITPEEGGKDVFFHASSVEKGLRFDDLQVGERVEFEVTESDRGPKAIGVCPV